MLAEEKCKNSPTVLVWCSTAQLPSGLLEIFALSLLRERASIGQRNPYSGWTPKSDSAHGTVSSSVKNWLIHHQSFQARLPLGHHRRGRPWKTTAGARLHSAFHKYHILTFLQKSVCPSFTTSLHFAKLSVLILGAPLIFRYHHQEYFQLLMGSQPPSADGHMKESTRLQWIRLMSDQATQDCHCHKTACKRLFQKLWILMASITLTSLFQHQGGTRTVPRTKVSMRVNHPLLHFQH